MSNSVVTVLGAQTALLELQRPLCAVPFHLTEHLPMETISFCKCCPVHSPQTTCLWQPLLSASVAMCTHHKAPAHRDYFFLQLLLCTRHKASVYGNHFLSAIAALCTHRKAPVYGNQFFLQVLPSAPTTKHLSMATTSFSKCYSMHFPQSICLRRPVRSASVAQCTCHKASAYGDQFFL